MNTVFSKGCLAFDVSLYPLNVVFLIASEAIMGAKGELCLMGSFVWAVNVHTAFCFSLHVSVYRMTET